MTKNNKILLLGGAVAIGAFIYSQNRSITKEVESLPFTKKRWQIPSKAMKYMDIFRGASIRHGVPLELLVRVAQQESYFNPAAYNKRSKAAGMMQIVLKWHPSVKNPYDPNEAIYYGAGYLKKLYNRFGSWRLALVAYNWGQGNLARKGIEKAPLETRNYHTEIMRDVGSINNNIK